MDWLTGLQEAIDYIENNILEKNMTSSDIASSIFSSEHNFRKIFSIITGVTVGEYIRNRRLSLAGEELLMSDATILDIALRYGYDTPESFTKAFTRFHGVTPSYVRKNRDGLKTYTRMVLRIEAGGGTTLDYSVEELGMIRIVGYQQCFVGAELEQNNQNIPEFVQKTLQKDYDGLSRMCGKGVFADSIVGYRCDIDNQMHYTVGVVVEFDEISDDYVVVELPARKWLRFRCEPSTKEALQRLWYRIYTEFMPFSNYQIEDNITLEVSYCMNGKDEKYLYMPICSDNN